MVVHDVQVIEVGGKNNFKNEFPALLNRFAAVKIYAIIRDADTDPEGTFTSVINLLRKYEQPHPADTGSFSEERDKVKVGVFIMPGNREEGMLEDLCLKTVENHPIIGCVDSFIHCLESILEKRGKDQSRGNVKEYFPNNISKARAQTFLAGKHDLVKSVGEAALNGYWNFDHASLKELKAFLNHFISLQL